MMQLIHYVLSFSLRTQNTTNVKVIKQINHFSTCI